MWRRLIALQVLALMAGLAMLHAMLRPPEPTSKRPVSLDEATRRRHRDLNGRPDYFGQVHPVPPRNGDRPEEGIHPQRRRHS